MRYWLIVLLLISLISGCEKINFFKPAQVAKKEEPPTPATKGTLIAKVNNIPVTLEELNRYIEIYNASLDLRDDLTPEQKKEAKIDTREKKLDYLKSFLIRQKVFYQAALDRGLERKEEIMDILQRDKIAVLAQEMQAEVVKNIDVSPAEIEEAYNTNKVLFKEPETRRIREIVSKTEEQAKQILIGLLQPGADFASLARANSIAESAKSGGDLGNIKKGDQGEEFANFDDMAFSPALQQGAISSVFKGPTGYYIIKVEEIKEGKQVSLNEARETIKALLLVQKQQAELDKVYSRLLSEYKIERYESEIK